MIEKKNHTRIVELNIRLFYYFAFARSFQVRKNYSDEFWILEIILSDTTRNQPKEWVEGNW